MRFGAIGPSYVAISPAIANEECINLYLESLGSQGALASKKPYGGTNAAGLQSLVRTPGVVQFALLPGGAIPRGGFYAGGRLFWVGGAALYEISAAGAVTNWGAVVNDGNSASVAYNSLQILIVSGGHAYCFTLATNALLDVTAQLAGVPVQCDGGDTYFIVSFQNSNKFQMSQVLDGTTWPGQLVNEVSVFPDNITSILLNHRDLWIWGTKRCQPYQDTGSTEVFDVIGGTLIEMGSAAAFAVARADNSAFWIHQDERGGRMAWRSNGYNPVRISTYAVEYDLSQNYTAAQIAGATSYSYQDAGHIFWVLYIPGSTFSWCYDISEGTWHKRAKWVANAFAAHWGWNYVYAFGKHLVGDWASGTIYAMELATLTDAGGVLRRYRRTPTVGDEMKWKFHNQLTIDIETGLGPQPPLLDGGGNPRDPQLMVRWSDDRGRTWSNECLVNCGQAGNYRVRAVLRRLGRSRYRIYEFSMTDAIAWTIVDAYLELADAA